MISVVYTTRTHMRTYTRAFQQEIILTYVHRCVYDIQTLYLLKKTLNLWWFWDSFIFLTIIIVSTILIFVWISVYKYRVKSTIHVSFKQGTYGGIPETRYDFREVYISETKLPPIYVVKMCLEKIVFHEVLILIKDP